MRIHYLALIHDYNYIVLYLSVAFLYIPTYNTRRSLLLFSPTVSFTSYHPPTLSYTTSFAILHLSAVLLYYLALSFALPPHISRFPSLLQYPTYLCALLFSFICFLHSFASSYFSLQSPTPSGTPFYNILHLCIAAHTPSYTSIFTRVPLILAPRSR